MAKPRKTKTSSDERCWWCGAPAGRLCDTPLAGTEDADGRRLISMDDGKFVTCDAVICESCSDGIRTTLVIPAKDRAPGEYWETMDRCPFCVVILAGPKLGPIVQGRRTLLTATEHRERCREHARRHFRPRLGIVRSDP